MGGEGGEGGARTKLHEKNSSDSGRERRRSGCRNSKGNNIMGWKRGDIMGQEGEEDCGTGMRGGLWNWKKSRIMRWE